MPLVVRQLSPSDAGQVAALWQQASARRRADLGLPATEDGDDVLARPGAFAVGVTDGDQMLAIAVAMPARGDDGRSEHNVPGLAHIASVATLPGHWGEGLATRCLHAVMCQATRRGYARAQLWTQASNLRAKALYERDGFELSGRETIHDVTGELIVHYHRELPTLPWQSRAAARLVCLDPDDRVLLLHWRDPYDGFQLWEPPGGGVEEGESTYQAVVREWQEETGLPVPDLSPEPTSVARDCVFNGVRGVTTETFYLGRLAVPGVPVTDASTPVEQQTLLGHAWVHWREMDALEDPREPDLLPVLHRLTGGALGSVGR